MSVPVFPDPLWRSVELRAGEVAVPEFLGPRWRSVETRSAEEMAVAVFSDLI